MQPILFTSSLFSHVKIKGRKTIPCHSPAFQIGLSTRYLSTETGKCQSAVKFNFSFFRCQHYLSKMGIAIKFWVTLVEYSCFWAGYATNIYLHLLHWLFFEMFLLLHYVSFHFVFLFLFLFVWLVMKNIPLGWLWMPIRYIYMYIYRISINAYKIVTKMALWIFILSQYCAETLLPRMF